MSVENTVAPSKKSENFLRHPAQHIKDILIAPENRQQTNLRTDFWNRPVQYVGDIARSPAVLFSLGNTAYGTFLGAFAGLDIGSGGATAIQLGITIITAGFQVVSTYTSVPGRPFRAQTWANGGTAAALVAEIGYEWVTSGGVAAAHKFVVNFLPICTFSFWGIGHKNVANYFDHLDALTAAGKTPAEIAADPQLKKLEKYYLASYGAADVLAPFKNQPINQIPGTLWNLATNPSLLATGAAGAFVALPFFIVGVGKTFIKKMPFIKNAGNAFASGYGVGSAISFVSAGIGAFAAAKGHDVNTVAIVNDVLFGVAQALWSAGWRSLTVGGQRLKPLSADQYAEAQRAKQNDSAKPNSLIL